MSTKTTIKRIALVAAVAAAFGGLSTVAAQASLSAPLYVSNTSTVDGTLAGVATSASSTAATAVNANGISSLTVSIGKSSVLFVGTGVATGSSSSTFASNDQARFVSNTLGVLGASAQTAAVPAGTSSAASWAANVETITATVAEGVTVGQTVKIAGLTPAADNGVFVITGTDATSGAAGSYYTVANSAGAAVTAGGNAATTAAVTLPVALSVPNATGTYAGYVEYGNNGTWDSSTNSAFSITVNAAATFLASSSSATLSGTLGTALAQGATDSVVSLAKGVGF